MILMLHIQILALNLHDDTQGPKAILALYIKLKYDIKIILIETRQLCIHNNYIISRCPGNIK